MQGEEHQGHVVIQAGAPWAWTQGMQVASALTWSATLALGRGGQRAGEDGQDAPRASGV